MKSKKTESSTIFKKKGFYAALYSCVGVVMVMAAVITYNTRNNALQTPERYANNTPNLSEEVASVNQSSVRSYLEEPIISSTVIPNLALQDDTAFFKPKETAPVEEPKEEKPEAKEAEPPKETSKEPVKEKSPEKPVEKEEAKPTNAQEETEWEATLALADPERSYEPAEATGSGFDGLDIRSSQFEHAMLEGNAYVDEMLSEPVFNIFADNQLMNWPVVGEILMDFSTDRTIFDKTLNHYRTNAVLAIQSELGSPVRVAAEGTVKDIFDSREEGISVVVDHGNGWTTTYSQLDADLLIAEGDVVLRNQELGKIGKPSIYRVALGEHLGFAVAKNDTSVDPKEILR